MTIIAVLLPCKAPVSWAMRSSEVSERTELEQRGLRIPYENGWVSRREMQGLRGQPKENRKKGQFLSCFNRPSTNVSLKTDMAPHCCREISSWCWNSKHNSSLRGPTYSIGNRRLSHARVSGNADNSSQIQSAVNNEFSANSPTEEEEQNALNESLETEASEARKPSVGASMSKTAVQLKDFLGRLPPVTKLGTTLLGISAGVILAWAVIQRTLLSPRFLMYASWFFVIWPWPTAMALGVWTLKTALKQKEKNAKEWEQLLVLGGALTWLILVPCGQFQGFVDGWPLVLFSIYYLFFCISAIVRLRLYGELSPREMDKQWSTRTSKFAQIGFVLSVVGGHWLAAQEARLTSPPLPWSSSLAWFLLGSAVVLHWQSTFFLGKYFDRLVVPKTIVTFGPYRWIRHPIYSSYILLFAGYCVALQSFLSLSFLVSACGLYYIYRVSLEEELLIENFGGLYEDYRTKVTKKFIPYIF